MALPVASALPAGQTFSWLTRARRIARRAAAAALAASLATLSTASAPTGTTPKRVYHLTRLHGPAPVIDGRLDDTCWSTEGEWAGDFAQFTPNYKAPPTHPTEIKILYDGRQLYVAMRAYDDPPEKRSIRGGERDEFNGDVMGINFDSRHDQRTGFEFDLTANGQKIDLLLFNNSWDTTWNAVWEGKVAHEAGSWTAEFLIPLSQLRFDPRETSWGLHAWRWIDRQREESDWQVLVNDDSGLVKSFGTLDGVEGLRSSRRIELLPYVSVRAEIPPSGSARTTFRAGLDAKIGLSSDVTLDASLRPDFGQVEADPAQMNLTAFETFLTERRPLFLEGKEVFDFPLKNDTVFYSRRIGQLPGYYPPGIVGRMPEASTLEGALKLSGKTSRGFAFGVLSSLTSREEVEVADAGTIRRAAIAPQAEQLVMRGQQDLRRGDTVLGGIVTHVRRELADPDLRSWLPARATAAGTDIQHYWADREYFLRCAAVASQVDGDPQAIARLQLAPTRYYQRAIDGVTAFDPSLDRLTGNALWLKFGKGSKGHWRWSEELFRKSPGFELNDLGFVSQTDRLEQTTSLGYSEKTPAAWYRGYQLELAHANAWTTRHEYLGTELALNSSAELRNKWTVTAALTAQGERRDPVALRGGPLLRVPPGVNWFGEIGTDNSRRLWAKAYAKGQRSREDPSAYDGYGGQVELRPVSTLLLALGFDAMNEVDGLRPVPLENVDGAAPGYFVARLTGKSRSVSVRTQWTIRPELTLRYYGNPFGSTVRYSDVRRVAAPGAADYASQFGPWLARSSGAGRYAFDEDGDGVAELGMAEPNFNAASFRSNLVLRWEFRRGSTLHLIWAQQRDGAASVDSLDAWSALSGLRGMPVNNQVMLKMTYWFSS